MVHEVTRWPGRDLTVFHVVAPATDDLNVIYVYCAGDTLQWVWHESYTAGLSYAAARGSVQFDGTMINALPALEPLVSAPSTADCVEGLQIIGTGIDYRDGVGSIVIDGKLHALYPFELVDCSECGGTDEGGWHEVHAITTGRGSGLVFIILYMFADAPGTIDLIYHVRFDPFRRGPGGRYEASHSFDRRVHTVTPTMLPLAPAQVP